VDDDTSLQITVSVREGSVPQVHAHAPVLAVRWGHEVRVVVSGTVLGVSDDGVVLGTTSAKVVLLEVSGDFIESVSY
jgi:hypothetical protein